MIKRYLVLYDIIDQAHLIRKANEVYEGNIIAVTKKSSVFDTKAVDNFMKDNGHAILTVKGGVLQNITALEVEV